MSRRRYSSEEIIGKLQEADVLLSRGQTVGQVSRLLGIRERTYYRWRKEYGRVRTDQAWRLKALEQENGRLRRLVADLPLDNAMMQETVSGNSGLCVQPDGVAQRQVSFLVSHLAPRSYASFLPSSEDAPAIWMEASMISRALPPLGRAAQEG